MKKIFCLFCIMTLLFTSIVVAVADSFPIVTIDPCVSGIPGWVIEDICHSHPDAKEIHITGWHNVLQSPNTVQPAAYGWTYRDIVVTKTTSDALLGDYFIISVARGAEKTLSSTWTKTISSSLQVTSSSSSDSPVPSTNTLGISASVTTSYTTTLLFRGPAESSPYNSRQYRVKFYGDKGTWSATAIWEVNIARRVQLTGTWIKPTYYLEYSIDQLVQ